MTDQQLIEDARGHIANRYDTDYKLLIRCFEAVVDRFAALQAGNADLRIGFSRAVAEWNAAMAYVPHACSTCKHKKKGVCGMGCEFVRLTINHAERCNWEWRGAQGEA